MGKTSSLLLGLELLSWCHGFCMAAQSVYWVAPTIQDCQAGENCNTLKEYARAGAFHQSNVVWIFKEGKHLLHGNIVVFSKVHNVTLTSSRTCEQQGINNCTIHCTGKQACMFLFVRSYNITVRNLCFIHQESLGLKSVSVKKLRQHLPENETLCYNHSIRFPSSMAHARFKNCLHDRNWVFVDVVHVTVSNVTFVGINSYWAVVRPKGNYKVMNCQFYNLYLAQTSLSGDPQHYLTVVLRKPHTNQNLLTFLITNSYFTSYKYLPLTSFIMKSKKSHSNTTGLEAMAYPVVHIISDEPLNGWKANITIEHCHFRRCAPFQLTANEDPGLTVTLNAVTAEGHPKALHLWQHKQDYIFMGSAIRLFLSNSYYPTKEPIQCYASTSHREQLQCTTNSSPQLSNITITSSQFMSFASEKGCTVLFEGRITDGHPKWLRIVLHNNTFIDCYVQKHRSIIYAHQNQVNHKSQRNQSEHQQYRLIINSNRSERNFNNDKMDRSCVVFDQVWKGDLVYSIRPGTTNPRLTCQYSCVWQGVYFISGFQQHDRVLFTGNTINENSAQGLTLVGSVLELEGKNQITRNRGHYGGGVAMYGNSQLWIRNCSYLNLSNNKAYVNGGGIFIYDPCTQDPFGECPCFFQFIGSNGTPLTNTSVGTFNASVIFHRNRAVDHANMIFNANSDHCFMEDSLQNSMKTEVFHQVFGIPTHKTQEDISSIPRSICNCSYSSNDSPKCTNWSQDPLPVYPGQNLTLNVMLMGDMAIPLESVLYVYLERKKYITEPQQYVPLPLHSTHVLRNCCNSFTVPPFPPK